MNLKQGVWSSDVNDFPDEIYVSLLYGEYKKAAAALERFYDSIREEN